MLHVWNARVPQFVEQYLVKRWFAHRVEMHWNLAPYAANLPPDRGFCCISDMDVGFTNKKSMHEDKGCALQGLCAGKQILLHVTLLLPSAAWDNFTRAVPKPAGA